MNSLEVKAVSQTLDPKTGTVVYETDIGPARPGILILTDTAMNKDMLIMNQYYDGNGPVKIIMRPFKAPARKFENGEVLARLIFL